MATVLMAAYTNYRRDPRVKREAEALVEAGHRVVFLASRQRGEPNREIIADVEVIKLVGLRKKCTTFAEYLFDYAIFFVMFSFHIFAHPLRYKLIHVNNMPDFLVFAAWLPRLFGCPVIHDVHDLMPELYREKFSSKKGNWVVRALEMQERWAGRFASVVLTVEEQYKDILFERGIPRDKIQVLMNLPDERIFFPRVETPDKAEDAPFVLVYHGTLARRLGLDIAIEAVAKAIESISRMELRIIGAGEEREGLIELRDTLGLQKIVTFSQGFVPVEKIPTMINDADVGVISSRISSGTDTMLPTKLLEYVSMGIPCIVPRTSAILRYFDAQMVEFFEAGDPSSLAEAIVRMYRNPKKRIQLSKEASERFAEKYKWNVHKKLYTKLVAQLIDTSCR